MTSSGRARCVAITGATGYLGSSLAGFFSAHGDDVVSLSRRQPSNEQLRWRPFSLGSTVDEATLADVDVLIHAAWGLGSGDPAKLWEENVIGSRALIDAAEAAGVRKVVFISSMSAYFGTKQTYGLMKLAVERTVLDKGYVAIRPGLVYGDSPGGMAGTLKKVSRLPLWPHFARAQLFVVQEEEIAPAMASVVDDYAAFAGHVVGFANPDAVGLAPLLTWLSDRDRPRPRVPVPAKSVILGLKAVEKAGVSLPFRSDSLLGLVQGPDAVPGQELLAARGIKFRQLGVV